MLCDEERRPQCGGRLVRIDDVLGRRHPCRLGWRLRRLLWGRRAKLGSDVKIDEFVRIDRAEGLEIGDSSFIGRGAFIHAGGGVTIGCDVLVGPGVKIWSADHCFGDRARPIRTQGHRFAPVVIEDDVWLGVDCIVLKGVVIGRGAVVGAGALVTRTSTDIRSSLAFQRNRSVRGSRWGSFSKVPSWASRG